MPPASRILITAHESSGQHQDLILSVYVPFFFVGRTPGVRKHRCDGSFTTLRKLSVVARKKW